jgi:threonyl-tRNA synthetase
VQAKVVTITDKQLEYAKGVRDRLLASGIRAELDARSEKMGFKIREAALEKVPYVLVVGDKEVQQDAVAVRERGGRDLGAMPVADFITSVQANVLQKSTNTELIRG